MAELGNNNNNVNNNNRYIVMILTYGYISTKLMSWLMLVVEVGEEASVCRGHLQQPIASKNSIPMIVNTWHILGSSTGRFIYKVGEE